MRCVKDFVAIPFQRGTEERADGFLIINDEYGCRGRIS
jgi:hypothetical protein